MNDPDRPYQAPQTAAQQTMQQPQSGSPKTTGGAGYGLGGELPQGPGKYSEQAGSKSLSGLVQALEEAIQLGENIPNTIADLRAAAQQADELIRQLGVSQAQPAGTEAASSIPQVQSKARK